MVDNVRDPGGPGRAIRLLVGPAGNRRAVRHRDAVAPQPQFQFMGEAKMRTAFGAAGRGQRMLQQCHQFFGLDRALAERRDLSQESPRRRLDQRQAGAVVRPETPAIERRLDAPRQHAVRCDKRGALAGFDRVTEDQCDCARLFARLRSLEHRDALHRLGQVPELRALGQPAIGHGRGSERKRENPAPVGVRGGIAAPGNHLPRAETERPGEAQEPVLRMILRRNAAGFETVPRRFRHVEIVARQDDGALGQPGDGKHQGKRRSPRSGRAGNDDRIARRRLRPDTGQPRHDLAAPSFGIGPGVRHEVAADDADELQALRPVPRVIVGEIRRLEDRGLYPFALHLAKKACEAVGEVERGAPGSHVLALAHEGRDQSHEVEPALERWHGQGQAGGRVEREIRDQPQARQQPRAMPVEGRAHRAQHPAGPEIERGLRHELRRVIRQPLDQAAHQFGGKICARRKGKQARAVGRLKHARNLAYALRQAQCSPGGRHRRNRRDARCRTAGLRRSSHPRRG